MLLISLLLASQILTQAGTNQLEAIAPEDIPPEKFYRAEVMEILGQEERRVGEYLNQFQVVRVKILSGDEKGKEIEIRDERVAGVNTIQFVKSGEKIIVSKVRNLDEDIYYIADKYRLPALSWILGIFFALGIIFGRRKGFTALLGLVVSILIIALFIVPQILDGKNPLLISLAGALVIAVVSILLAHGANRRTSIALASTLLTLGIAAGLSYAFVSFGKLFGLGSEEAFYLQVFPGISVNLQGLLIGGIIIGALGVLDDITTSQAAAVEELSKANPALSTRELYQRGISIGREHIAALINTLALAYAGASLPLFLLFTLNKTQPLWVILNSELVAEEVVRTLVGSAALIFAVPITTYLAARFLKVKNNN